MPPPPHHPTHHHGGGGGGHGGLPGRGNSGAQYIGLEMLVPKQYLGNVIGKAGKYINAVRSQYGVDIKVLDFDPQRAMYAPPNGDPAALLVVQGTREHAWPAAAKCVQNLLVGAAASPPVGSSASSSRDGGGDDGPASDGDADSAVLIETLYLEATAVPRVIGRGGSRINLIRTSSRCKISIEQHQDARDSDMDMEPQNATCTIEGRPREIAGARMLIEARETLGGGGGAVGMQQMVGHGLGVDPAAMQQQQQQQQQQHQQRGGANGGGAAMAVDGEGSGRGDAPPGGVGGSVGLGGGAMVLELFVPKKFLGQIIGRAGKYINAARVQTGCDIRVDDSNAALVSATGEPLATLSITGMQGMAWAAAGHVMGHLLIGKPGPEEGDGSIIIETLTVPTEAVGHIIGKAGQRINLIRQSSNCKIQLEQPDNGGGGGSGGGVAVITLEGVPRSVLAARTMLQAREVKPAEQQAAAAAGQMAGMGGGMHVVDDAQQQQQQQQQSMDTGGGDKGGAGGGGVGISGGAGPGAQNPGAGNMPGLVPPQGFGAFTPQQVGIDACMFLCLLSFFQWLACLLARSLDCSVSLISLSIDWHLPVYLPPPTSPPQAPMLGADSLFGGY